MSRPKATIKTIKKQVTKHKDPKARRRHGNSKRDSGKREEFIWLIKRDLTFISACDYIWMPERTIRDWVERDEELSQEYRRALTYMDFITSNAITKAILDTWTEQKDRAKLSFEWKKRRDKRYRDNAVIESTVEIKDDFTGMTWQELQELKKKLLKK